MMPFEESTDEEKPIKMLPNEEEQKSADPVFQAAEKYNRLRRWIRGSLS
jgi:hypothetical protein